MKKRLLLTLFAACTLAAGAQTLAEDAEVSGGVPVAKPNALTVKADDASTTASSYIWRQQSALYIFDAALDDAAIVLPAQVDDADEPTGCGTATFTAEYTGNKAYWTYATANSADEDPVADTLDIADDADKALSITLYDGQFAASPILFAVANTDTVSLTKANYATAGYDASQCGLAYDNLGQGFTNFAAGLSKYANADWYDYTLGSKRATMASTYKYDSISPKGFGEYFNLEGAPMVLPAVKAWVYADETNAPATADLQACIYTRTGSEADWKLQATMPCSSVTNYTTKKGKFRGYWVAFDTPALAEKANDSHVMLADTALFLDGVTEMLVAIENPNGDELNCGAVGSIGVSELQDVNYGYYHFEYYSGSNKTDKGYEAYNLNYSKQGYAAIGYWIALNGNNTAEAIAEAKVLTGIANVEAEAAKNAGRKGTFDLQGRRVNQMGKGIYVVDGQKILK